MNILGQLRQCRTLLDQSIDNIESAIGVGPRSKSTGLTLINHNRTPVRGRKRGPMPVATKRLLSEKAKQQWAQRKKVKVPA